METGSSGMEIASDLKFIVRVLKAERVVMRHDQRKCDVPINPFCWKVNADREQTGANLSSQADPIAAKGLYHRSVIAAHDRGVNGIETIIHRHLHAGSMPHNKETIAGVNDRTYEKNYGKSHSGHRAAGLNSDRNNVETVIALLSNVEMNDGASKIGGMANHEHENDGHGKRYDAREQHKGDR